MNPRITRIDDIDRDIAKKLGFMIEQSDRTNGISIGRNEKEVHDAEYYVETRGQLYAFLCGELHKAYGLDPILHELWLELTKDAR